MKPQQGIAVVVLAALALVGAWFVMQSSSTDIAEPAPAVSAQRPSPSPKRAEPAQAKPFKATPAGKRQIEKQAPAEDGAPTAAEERAGNLELTVWPLTREGIRGAIMEVAPHVKDCYEDALKEVPDLSGRMTVAFDIEDRDGIGTVVNAGVEDDQLHDGPIEDCLLDAMEALQFDPPEGGETTVSWPFVFQNAE